MKVLVEVLWARDAHERNKRLPEDHDINFSLKYLFTHIAPPTHVQLCSLGQKLCDVKGPVRKALAGTEEYEDDFRSEGLRVRT